GLGLFYVSQGVGRGVAAMNANAVRMIASAVGGLVAIYWFDLGVAGFFAAVAVYAAILVHAVSGVKTPNAACARTTKTDKPYQPLDSAAHRSPWPHRYPMAGRRNGAQQRPARDQPVQGRLRGARRCRRRRGTGGLRGRCPRGRARTA